MKKIINGKVYDTRTAELVGSDENGAHGFEWCEETLYRKRTGEFFIYGRGGPRSIYCERDGSLLVDGEAIKPLPFELARSWAEAHLKADDYIRIFGDPGEGDAADEKRQVTLYLTAATIAKIKRAAAQGGQSMSGWIEAAVDAALAAG